LTSARGGGKCGGKDEREGIKGKRMKEEALGVLVVLIYPTMNTSESFAPLPK